MPKARENRKLNWDQKLDFLRSVQIAHGLWGNMPGNVDTEYTSRMIPVSIFAVLIDTVYRNETCTETIIQVMAAKHFSVLTTIREFNRTAKTKVLVVPLWALIM